MICDFVAVRSRYRAAALRLKFAFLELRLTTRAGFKPDQPRDDRGRWSGGGGSGTLQITQIDRTGEIRIDRTTDHLVDIVAGIFESKGPGRGPLYGTDVHTVFAQAMRNLDLPGIGRDGVEQSFDMGGLVRYGLDGSIRTDVVKRGGRSASSPIIAVWDSKTG